METRPQDLRDIMVERFLAAARAGTPIAVVVSDSTSTAKIKSFAEAFPERLVNVGIAEQNLVGVAAGLALGGLTSFTCNAACFLTARAHEQIRNDVCYSQANVKLVGLNAGIAYGPLAATHYAVDDIAIMRGLAGIEIVAPGDPSEAGAVFDYALSHAGPLYVRLDNAAFPRLHPEGWAMAPGRAEMLRPGSKVTLCATGSLTCQAVAAADLLAKDSIEAEVLSCPWLRPFDSRTIARSAAKTGRVMTVEEHTLAGGLGSLVAETLAESSATARLKRLGFPEGIFLKPGPRREMRRHYGLDAQGIAEAAAAWLNN
jgi:transketolase